MKVGISDFDHKDNHGFFDGEKRYRVTDLIELSKDMPVFELPLSGLNIGYYPWESEPRIKDILFHVKRINEADLKYPIILDDCGRVADGWHRICKAILQGDEFIKAVRLTKMPTEYEVIKTN